MIKTNSTISIASEIVCNLKGVDITFDPAPTEPTKGEVVPVSASSLHPAVLACLRKLHPNGLFTHQHQAIENALKGNDTVTATRTSSGKSLTFALPALHMLCEDPNSTAMFLYPQKALANDQIHRLKVLAHSLSLEFPSISSHPLSVCRYDGSTPKDDRPGIRDQVQLLATNPDMLHLGILRHHQRIWARFFANLKLIAIDECHDYRGAFGTHVAMVLHRLLAVCRLHGSNPVITASSATIAQPQHHLNQLTGRNFDLIGPEMDRSQQGRRKIWMIEGHDHHHRTGRHLAVKLVEAGLRVLVFCPSRTAAEEIAGSVRATKLLQKDHVAVYRAGLTGDDREAIERGMLDGSKRLVFTTSALELGVDIGALDVVVCIGLPSTMMSLMQRMGRAARGGREGALILIPGNSPIESFYASNPEQLFARDNEPIAINIRNPKIVCQHYAAAILEHGNDKSAIQEGSLGPLTDTIQQAQESPGWLAGFACSTNDPHGIINLRCTGDTSFSLYSDRKKIGDIGRSQLLREAPPNAIYRHAGISYRVLSISEYDERVQLVPERTDHKTTAFIRKALTLRQKLRSTFYNNMEIATGLLRVDEFLMSLTEKDRSGRTVNFWEKQGGLPRCQLFTEGTIVVLGPQLVQHLRQRLGSLYECAAQSAERLLAGLFPTVAGPCDPQDYSSGTLTMIGGSPAIALYDTAPGGIGLTDFFYRRADELVRNALERVAKCQCENDQGCIRCVVHPYQEAASSKTAAVELLGELAKSLASGVKGTWTSDEETFGFANVNTPAQCPKCECSVQSTSNFCGNCGHKLETVDV